MDIFGYFEHWWIGGLYTQKELRGDSNAQGRIKEGDLGIYPSLNFLEVKIIKNIKKKPD